MGRHGKNQTASAVYSYHEKKKDTATSGYGSQSVRLGKDSLQGFDCCTLSLQPCRQPVVTPHGYLFEREAILESLLHQKRENARKMKEYEKQRKKQETELEELAKAEARDRLEKFVSSETRLSSTQDGNEMKSSKLPSFWVPSLTPSVVTPSSITKPDNKTYCPMSGHPLRVKDLVTVNFTSVHNSRTKEGRYMCPVTHDILSNSTPAAVLRPSGHVVTMDCVERIIRKNNEEGMVCPMTGVKLKESDIIPLVRGGTGFAGAGIQLKAKKHGPVLMS